MGQQLRCIYCGRFCSSKGKGDHVIPAVWGEFRGAKQFHAICRSCNNAIGKYEEQLTRCSPEAILANNVIPATKRGRWRARKPFQAAHGAPSPVFRASSELGNELVRPMPGGNYQPLEQLMLWDCEGKAFHVRLYPGMPAHKLQDDVKALNGVGPYRGIVKCESQNEDRYISLVEEAWPNSTLQTTTDDLPGVTPVDIEGTCQLGRPYRQAIAKVALNYYLLHSARHRGFEPDLRPIKRFIRWGKESDQFFLNRDPFEALGLKRGCYPARWCHVLAGGLVGRDIVVSLYFFVGLACQGIGHSVRLAACSSRIHLSSEQWAHVYEYYYPEERTKTYQGQTRKLPTPRRLA